MAAATPISPHHDRSKGGERSEGEDLTTPPGARRRKRPDAAGLWQAPAQAGRRPEPRPEHGRFPGQAALRKPPGTHRRTRPAPKMHRSITRTSPLERDGTNPGKKRTLTSLETNTLFICKAFRHLNGFGCVHALFDSCYRVISSHIP